MLKRLVTAILLGVLSIILFNGLVLAAWEFMFPITISDTSNTTRNYYPVVLGFGGQPLVESGKISANGTNTNMQLGSSNVTYMMSTTNVTAVVPTLPSGGVANIDLYTDFSPVQSGFPIITGSGGYVTVTDNATMEVGDNFSIEQYGYVDTSSANRSLTYKQDALMVYVSDVEEITGYIIKVVSVWSTPSLSDGGAWANPANGVDDNTTSYTEFTVNNGAWSDYLVFGQSSNITAGFRYWVTRENNDINLIDIDAYYSGGWGDFYQGAIGVIGGWQERLSLDVDPTLYRMRFYNDSGAVNFWVRMHETDFGATCQVVATNVGSGEHTVELSADSVDLVISIDGAVAGDGYDSMALGLATVTDNGNDWLFCQDDAMPYVDNITLSVNGTQQLWFAPTVMLTGAVVPDRSGNSHDGTITWGSNSNVTVLYGEMSSYESYTASGSNVTTGFDVDTVSLPSTWFAAGENVADLPFYDSFSEVAAQTGRPVQMFYSLAIVGVAFGVFIGIAVFTRSALLAYIAMLAVFGFGASMTVIPAWMVFAMAIVGTAIMYLYRQVAY